MLKLTECSARKKGQIFGGAPQNGLGGGLNIFYQYIILYILILTSYTFFYLHTDYEDVI